MIIPKTKFNTRDDGFGLISLKNPGNIIYIGLMAGSANIIRLLIIFAAAGLLVMSCGQKKNLSNYQEDDPSKVVPEEKVVPEKSLIVSAGNEETVDPSLEDDLFGKFFNDRAEFYIIENPTNTLFDTPIQSITLYYLDGELSKTKYQLGTDIGLKLYEHFGMFHIKGFDPINTSLIKKKRILFKTDDNLKINPELTNYELSWKLDGKQIKWRVNTTAGKSIYTYTERLNNYENAFKQIEYAAVY